MWHGAGAQTATYRRGRIRPARCGEANHWQVGQGVERSLVDRGVLPYLHCTSEFMLFQAVHYSLTNQYVLLINLFIGMIVICYFSQ